MPDKTQSRDVQFYNLDVIISVGYRIRSHQGTQFRIWATQRWKEYIVKGFALNDERFKTGNSMAYFTGAAGTQSVKSAFPSASSIRKSRISIPPASTTTPGTKKTVEFFKVVQNKLLWAISRQTAAELVYRPGRTPRCP